MDFDQAVIRRKRFALDPKTVAAERKIADGDVSGVVGGKGAMKLDRVTGELDGRSNGKTVRTGDFEAKFSGVTLRQKRKSEKENAELER